MLAVLDSPRLADKSPGQVRATLLDEGVYLCSQATMYRLLRMRGTVGERRARAVHRARRKPELTADGPNQVWSWDITKPKGPGRGVHYLLYVILDIFSRKVIWWEIWPTETGILAKEFIEHAIEANDGIAPEAIHADRGTAMTSNTVSGLPALLGVDQSRSRPRVSNDNPYSEAQFKTFKYCPAFPGESRTPTSSASSSSATTTPNTAISGSGCTPPPRWTMVPAVAIHARRAATLNAAFLAHPERFRGRRPSPPPLPSRVWINKPTAVAEADEAEASAQTPNVA
ncbi:DDE-type integrase/transposase/recombinase [Streptosporangium fragile]|uniref:DDE-type integrase/transposase/recombinase n=1 Tax=Streptosporangium fragile TaxID=46186 RepID=UPI0031EC77D8